MADFKAANPELVVDSPPFFVTGSVADTVTNTITFDNVTKQVEIGCISGAGTLRVGVSAAGLAGTSYISLAANGTTGMIDMRVKKLMLYGNGTTMVYQVLAVLDRTASADYPDLTTANGFAGV